VPVPITQTTLANGLTVIVHEARRTPIVAVNVWYHVGSKHETPGATGLAHLFEHLMFEGALHQPRGYFAPLQEAGAALNGSTSADRTNYWETVPRSALSLALWMEADRMGWMAAALSDARFRTQRDVVINERRQSYENRPYGRAAFALLRAIFPEGHPYRWPTIGSVADLERATLDDAQAFLARFYHPGNASLVVAGDVDAAEIMARVEDEFGAIPGGRPAPPVAARQPEAAASRTVLADRVEVPRLYLAWPTPALFDEGDAELDLAADILANGRTSRLYRRLIHDRRVATEVGAAQSSRQLGSFFQVVVTPAPDASLETLAAAVREEIARLAADGVEEDELTRGRAQAEAAFVYRVQSLGGFGGVADQLNAYWSQRRSPDWFDQDLARYTSASAEAIRGAVARWLDPDRAAAISVVPRGAANLALPDSVPAPEDL
jgi:zinc protease